MTAMRRAAVAVALGLLALTGCSDPEAAPTNDTSHQTAQGETMDFDGLTLSIPADYETKEDTSHPAEHKLRVSERKDENAPANSYHSVDVVRLIDATVDAKAMADRFVYGEDNFRYKMGDRDQVTLGDTQFEHASFQKVLSDEESVNYDYYFADKDGDVWAFYLTSAVNEEIQPELVELVSTAQF